MKKVHISFGDGNYKESLDLLEKTTMENGSDFFMGYTKSWLFESPFYKNNKMARYILNQPRGAGYWAWKPYVILEAFDALEEGDIVLYSDAGLKVIGNLNPLYEIAQRGPNGGKILFKLPAVGVTAHLAKTWTRRDTFVLMEANTPKFWEADMSNGAVSLWKKTPENIEFLKEWKKHCLHPNKITDIGNLYGVNDMTFRDHRHDQSILTILATKYDFELFRDPTQYGNEELNKFSNSPYPQLFHHHRNFKHPE